jgi:hypothetical protein
MMNDTDTESFYLRPYVDARIPHPHPPRLLQVLKYVVPLLPILIAAAVGYVLGSGL